MEPRRVRRIVIPLVVGLVALVVLLVYAFSPGRPAPVPPTGQPPAEVAPPEEQPEDNADQLVPGDPSEVEPPPSVDAPDDAVAEEPDEPADIAAPEVPDNGVSLEGLRAIPTVEVDPSEPLATVGSLDPGIAPMLLEFTRTGAGIARITMSEYWQTAWAKREADAHYSARTARDPNPPPLPDEQWRYVLKEQKPFAGTMVPIFAAHSIEIGEPGTTGSERVYLWEWAELGPGQFATVVVNERDEPVLRITRRFALGATGDITLTQHIENLSGRELSLRWNQYGPGDLELERARYFDSRRFRFGYLQGTARDPQEYVYSDDTKLVLTRADVVKRSDRDHRLWPNDRSIDRQYILSWFAATNRYFALAVHPVLDELGRGDRSLTDVVDEIHYQSSTTDASTASVFTTLISPELTLGADETLDLDIGIYAGPMDRKILGEEEPYKSLGMDGLILYMMSTMCAMCTFQWLAGLLMSFLSFLHDWVLHDWGLAIIALVCVVRLLLHPITKRSQINMMRFGKQMQKMKPEVEKLQKKYKDDPKRMQQEQLRLMREHGVNPFQLLGCLPMVLQIPIWIALYAMLYFAFDIRHQPAFFGVFQAISGGAWPFLADLSSGDHFLGEFKEPYPLFGFYNITGLNLLPILLGVVFFIHQKYMTPPQSATMTPEQVQQQKIMRVMLVVMMPIFLYPAPAGLTMYIITSSVIGIIESRYVRAHVDQMDLEGPESGPAKGPRKPKPKKPRDPQGRAYAEALERAQKKRRDKGKAPSWKKRK